MRLALLLLLVCGTLGCARAQPAPEENSNDERSPRGDLFVQRRPASEDATEIWLASASDPTRRRLLYAYDRSATVLFSSDEKWLVINDHSGSSESEALIFRQKAPLDYEQVTDLSDAAWNFFRHQNHWTNPWLFDHYYLDALRWANDDPPTLLLCLEGHMDSRNYTSEWYCFYDVQARTFNGDLPAHNQRVTRLDHAEGHATLRSRLQVLNTRWIYPVTGGLLLLLAVLRKAGKARRQKSTDWPGRSMKGN